MASDHYFDSLNHNHARRGNRAEDENSLKLDSNPHLNLNPVVLSERQTALGRGPAALDDKIKQRTLNARNYRVPVSSFLHQTDRTDLQIDGIDDPPEHTDTEKPR